MFFHAPDSSGNAISLHLWLDDGLKNGNREERRPKRGECDGIFLSMNSSTCGRFDGDYRHHARFPLFQVGFSSKIMINISLLKDNQ